jgi:hypothetical protein
MNAIGTNDNVCCRSVPDFTTEITEITETDRKQGRVRIRIRNPLFPASVPSVPSVVKFRAAEGLR